MGHPVLDLVIGLDLALVLFYIMIWTVARRRK